MKGFIHPKPPKDQKVTDSESSAFVAEFKGDVLERRDPGISTIRHLNAAS
jgi:hypothetical protein